MCARLRRSSVEVTIDMAPRVAPTCAHNLPDILCRPRPYHPLANVPVPRHENISGPLPTNSVALRGHHRDNSAHL